MSFYSIGFERHQLLKPLTLLFNRILTYVLQLYADKLYLKIKQRLRATFCYQNLVNSQVIQVKTKQTMIEKKPQKIGDFDYIPSLILLLFKDSLPFSKNRTRTNRFLIACKVFSSISLSIFKGLWTRFLRSFTPCLKVCF